jgi:3-oxoacyl-[acyl-carrier protein] reductase
MTTGVALLLNEQAGYFKQLNQLKMSKLASKVALIIGASKGIGTAIATYFAADGAKVVVNYASSQDGADKVVQAITEAGGTAISLQGDVSKEADVARLFAETNQAFGRVDILVNNAGTYQYAPLEEVSIEAFHQHFNINVLGALLAMRAAVKQFGAAEGTIINISSEAGRAPLPTGSVYSASKAALDAMTTALPKEFSGRNIRINSILPGIVETEGSHSGGFTGSDAETKLVATTPQGRTGQPANIAKVAVFLASDDATWITGEKSPFPGDIRAVGNAWSSPYG